MKTMLKLSVLSFVFAVTLQAEPPASAEGSHAAAGGNKPAASTSSPSAETSQKTAEELTKAINTCLDERKEITKQASSFGL